MPTKDETNRQSVSGLSSEEAFRRILDLRVEFRYSDNKDLFDRWWRPLPSDVKPDLEVAAEGFHDWYDLHAQWVLKGTGGVFQGGTLRFDQAYRQFDAGLPRLSRSDYERTAKAVRSGERQLHRGKESSKARLLVDEHLRKYESAIREAFGVNQGRPNTPDRVRLTWSRWQYEGLTYGEITEKWNAEHPTEKEKDDEAIRRAVTRFRESRENIAWGLRVMVLRLGFPPLQCPTCKGEGELPNPGWEPWFEWDERRQKAGAQVGVARVLDESDPEPETPSTPASSDCPGCGGSGDRLIQFLTD